MLTPFTVPYMLELDDRKSGMLLGRGGVIRGMEVTECEETILVAA